MIQNEEIKRLFTVLDKQLQKNFKSVFIREFPIYKRYTLGEDILAVIWFTKKGLEIGACAVKSPTKWENTEGQGKYTGINYHQFITSEEEGKFFINDITITD